MKRVATAIKELEGTGLHWHAEGTSTDVVADSLAKLLREAEHLGGDHVSLRTMNLIVAPDPHKDNGHSASMHETALHPARMIRLVEHKPDRLDADIRVRLIELGDAGMNVVVEDITITANRSRLDHATSLLAPLLARGLPTVAWLPGYDHGRIEDELSVTAHVTVFDSDRDPDPARAIAFAHHTALAHPSRDLAWLRTLNWRRRISAAFSSEHAQGTLAFAPSGDVVGNVDSPAAMLLAAWIAVRADVNVTLRPGTGTEVVEAVTVAGIAIPPGSGAACSVGMLGEALDTVYSAPLGYEDALQSLDRVAIVG
ncbi:MAG: glucose-6-phosphate dehydrogenase assembly protein OpcA [Actinobacteria bacterium]|nr:glucose-6-phosphate dehydrogenase assembly protein OpcA [Actinomycetota bacterium]